MMTGTTITFSQRFPDFTTVNSAAPPAYKLTQDTKTLQVFQFIPLPKIKDLVRGLLGYKLKKFICKDSNVLFNRRLDPYEQ